MKNCFLKICLIFSLFNLVLLHTSLAQTITVQPEVATELGIYTDVSLWVSAPAGQEVNAEFLYFTENGDTSVTNTISNVSLGVSHQFEFDNVTVLCDSTWTGFVNVWITGQDTIQSNLVSWLLPCAGEVALSFSVAEIVDTGVVITLDYNSGGVPAGLYWFTSVSESPLQVNSIDVFGIGTHTDTLFISGGVPYEVCNPEINNGFDVVFLLGCISGEMDGFVPSTPDVSLSFVATDSLETELLIFNSGNVGSDFVISIEKMLCNGTFELYEEFEVSFDEIILDSLITFPVLTNLPSAPVWRATVTGDNGEYDLASQSVTVDIASDITPTISVSLTDEGNGFYEAITTWNDFGAGNVLLSYYVDGDLVGTLVPSQNTEIFPIPTQINSYSGGLVEVTLTSNSCMSPTASTSVSGCGINPTHILESANDITTTSANVQISYAYFGGCVQEAMVGVILVGVDTVWTPLSVNTEQTSNYIIQLTNLTPGQTYVYLGVLYAEGEYFTTNFSLSFTTLSVEPYFTNFSVNWDMSMLITMFTNYNLGDMSSVGLRVYHDGPTNSVVEILDVTVSNEFTSFDYDLSGEYGTHIVWAELYNTQTNVLYEATDPAVHTFQQPVGITELDQPVTRFDVVSVYDFSGRMVRQFANGETLSLEVPVGFYIFVGWKEEIEPVSSTIYLGQ